MFYVPGLRKAAGSRFLQLGLLGGLVELAAVLVAVVGDLLLADEEESGDDGADLAAQHRLAGLAAARALRDLGRGKRMLLVVRLLILHHTDLSNASSSCQVRGLGVNVPSWPSLTNFPEVRTGGQVIISFL